MSDEVPTSAGEVAGLANANLINANARLQSELAEAQSLKNRDTAIRWRKELSADTRAEIAQLTADAAARVKAIEEEMGTSYFEC